MQLLHIVKTRPDDSTEFLIKALSEGKEASRLNLYEDADYDKVVEQVFAADEVISWW
jgi:hypothetical protein